MKKLFFLLTLTVGVASMAAAQQISPRVDDHFWRKRVVVRIDTREKINQPFVAVTGKSYEASEGRFGTRTKGIIDAMIEGFRTNKFVAYKYDTLNQPLDYAAFAARLAKLNGSGAAVATPATGEATEGSTDDPMSEFGPDDLGGEDDFGGDFGGDEFGSEGDAGAASGDAASAAAAQIDLSPVQTAFELVEDRVFDKVRSDMVYEIKYIRLMWIDPEGKLPSEYLCAFKFSDLKEMLDQTQWKNRFNDAEHRSMKEILDMRLFSGFVVELSDAGSNSLAEAETRRQQMIEFEHHLWSY